MNQSRSRDTARNTHWVGVDVAKQSFDAGLVRCGQHFPNTKLHEIPAATFECSAQGVKAFLSWLDTHGLGDSEVRVVMEATGR